MFNDSNYPRWQRVVLLLAIVLTIVLAIVLTAWSVSNTIVSPRGCSICAVPFDQQVSAFDLSVASAVDQRIADNGAEFNQIQTQLPLYPVLESDVAGQQRCRDGISIFGVCGI